ncbi:hypothetical protein ABNX05_02425 [Lysinibacillus sp. M3]|uniref:DUF2642 domain-containing protein n=1 Tax=Lysinibacillus zambalensis TaxID=3160866 RepID=A0ABV1MN11_9BACI
MPIINNCIGDILVQIGYKRFESPGAIQFMEVNPLLVGISVEIESQDIVISQLKNCER